jgi:HEAT repeat protein
MSQNRRRGIVVGLAAGAAALLAGVWAFWPRASRSPAPLTGARETAAASSPAEAIRNGDAKALAAIHERLSAGTASRLAPTEAEVAEWVAILQALPAAYPRSSPRAKIARVELTGMILDRLSVEGTPAGWPAALVPSHDVLSAAMSDPDADVRTAALRAVGHLWVWAPGRSLSPSEEEAVASWKESFYAQVVEGLADPSSAPRIQAIACLGSLPIDSKAAPALAHLTDPDVSVRLQVLSAFANRPQVLTEEAILPLLHDPIPDLQNLAARILKARGLNADLIGLGKMVTHPRAEIRASAIPLLVVRDDIDPVVWLLRLSEDADESVRLRAVEAFKGRASPDIAQRLREMAVADESSSVRAAASKLAPPPESPTASLPPLPGTPGLNARAN